jgi:transglutaminase-like putative cysteine protease
LLTAGLALAVAVVTTTALVRLSLPNALPASEGLRLAVAILWRAVPIMVVMYLLFPRIQGSLWGLPADAFDAHTGLNDTVTPGSITELSSSDAVAFRVDFAGQIPPMRQLYWRSLVLSRTDGRTWSRAHEAVAVNAGIWPSRGVGEPIDYTIDYEATGRRWLVAMDVPATVPADATARPGFIIEALRPVRKRFQYAVRSYPSHSAEPLAPAARARQLRTPQPMSRRVQALVDAWQREPDPVLAVLRYFHDQDFGYTLTPPLLRGDYLDEFLFESRRGYCEHYAAAFAMLMRHLGIPSRLVVGYQGGEWNAAGGYLVVRQADAHAWVEVWRRHRGWTRVDPTAAVAPERIELGTAALQALLARGALPGELDPAAIRSLLEGRWLARQWHRLAMYWDATNTAWNRWVMAYGPERQQRFLQSLGFDTPSWTQVAATLVIGVAALLLVLSATLLWTRNRTDPVTASYRRFCAKLSKSGMARHAHEGPLDYCHRILTTRPDLAAESKPIIALYVSLRYGNVNSPDLVEQLRGRVRRFKAAGQ